MAGFSGKFAGRRGAGAAVILVLAAFAVTVGIAVLRSATGSTEVVAPDDASAAPTISAAGVYVHVAGAVRVPGLYTLEPGSRVADAVAAAGGFAPDADRAAGNLARPLQDGEQVLVPVVGAAPPAAAAAGADAPLDVNSADAAALEELPGIGPALAARIVAWREENGRFASVEDLLAVPGIGEKLLAAMRESVRV